MTGVFKSPILGVMNTLNSKNQKQSNDALNSPPFCSAQTPDEISAQSAPPSGNTGGKFIQSEDPNTGEKFYIGINAKGNPQIFYILNRSSSPHPYSAITDFLNCTFLFDQRKNSLADLFQKIIFVLGSKFAPIVNRNRGLYGYSSSFDLGKSSAIFAIGGQSDTAFLSMSGTACSLIQDWNLVVNFFRDSLNARITRWDGAVDDIEGVHSIDYAVHQYQQGLFNAGGNKPSCSQNGNWLDPDGSGRTFNIGKRKNGKMIRIYEKGMQLGAKWHPWTRWEVELHNVDRLIPWEVLIESGNYFVGCYPKALVWVQKEMTRIRTMKCQSQISYDVLTEYASVAYGSLFNVMLEIEGSAEAVIKRLLREGRPKRLKHPFIDSPSKFIDPSGEQS